MVNLRLRLRIFIGLLIVIIVMGTLGFRFTEGLSLVDAFYFSIVTIATVGYGDIHPSSEPGKFLAMFLILCGVGIFLGVVANATEIIVYQRERQARLEKLKAIMATFFSEIGNHLLEIFSSFDPRKETLSRDLKITGNWSQNDFSAAKKSVAAYDFSIDTHLGDLAHLSSFLKEKGDGLLRYLENPALQECDSFSDLLYASIHLRDEFLYRTDLNRLPDSDYGHIAKDIQRAYRLLVYQWLEYMKYLKNNYPYLFHLALRINPFDPEASPVVT